MAVSPWNYYRGAAAVMAARPRRPARQRADRAAVRRRPRAELRPVGHAGAEPGVRPARLRRDPARPVRVGRQALRRQPRGGGARERGQAGQGRRRGHRRRRGLPQAHAPVRGHARARHLVRRHPRRRPDRLLRARRPRPDLGPHREEARAPHQPRCLRQAHGDGARAPADHRGPPAPRHDRRRRAGGPRRPPAGRVPADPCRRTGGACSTGSPRPIWSARSWGWAAWG